MNFNAKKSRLNSFFLNCRIVLLTTTMLASSVLGESVQLTPRRNESSFTRVKTVVELAGSLNVARPKKGSQGSEELEIPLKVNAEMFFDEHGLAEDSDGSIRHYWDAKADFEVNEETNEHRELRPERQLIQLSGGQDAPERISSPHGPLTREEIELIDVPSNGFPPERLLPKHSVEVDDTWTHSNEVVAELLRIGTVNDGKLTSKLTKIDSEKVTIELNGEVGGEVDGVATKLEVKGNYQFDRSDRIVSWVALAIRERREISFSAPGFHVVSKVRTARQAISASDGLTPELIARLKPRNESDLLLDFVSDNHDFRMAIDRRWHLLAHRKFSSTLRMVEDGDLLATCKVDQLTKSVPGKQVTLDGFREDVQSALDKNCKNIESASQSVNPQGVRVLRVVAEGDVSATPIRWIYYHLSNDDGQRLSFIFTLEASLASRFDNIDQSMTSSVKFLEPEAAEPAEVSEVSRTNRRR